jgi:hypothetical protein
VGFEPKIPVSERAKTVRALDRAVTVIGFHGKYWSENFKGRDNLKELGTDKKNMKIYLKAIYNKGVDWIQQDQDRVKWSTFGKQVVDFRIYKQGIY